MSDDDATRAESPPRGLKELFTEMSDDDATRAESPPRGVDSYFRPGNFEDPSPIIYPAMANGAVSNFKIQPNLIAILPVFRGHEEPYVHLREFFSIADTYQVNNTNKDGVRPGSHLSNQAVFTHGEQFHEAFSRLKELLRTFPYHNVPKWELVKVFYDGLDYHNQQFVMATSGGKGVPNVSQVSHNACSMCGDPSHLINNCQSLGEPSNEEVNGVYGNRPRNDPFSESYNPRWRNHLNFRWKDDDNYNRPNNTQQQNHGYKPRPQQYQNHDQGSSNGQQSNVDQKFDLVLSELAKSNQGANLKFESLSKSVVNLERQIGQLAKEVHKREAGKLPRYPKLNPKHKPCGPEHVNMVTSLRNGKTYNNDIKIPSAHDFSHDVKDFVTDDEIIVEGKKADNVKSDFELETFKQVKINLPLIDAIKQIPAYAKFLKDLYTQKRKLKVTLPKKIDLTEHVSVVLSSSLPPKFKDLGAPLISVVVGNITIKKALLDLGASIKILPGSLVDKYDLGTLLDFFVMDTESPYKDVQPNIILGRPFLATIDARINCRTGTMDIAFGNMKLRLNVFNSLNSPISNDCYHIDTIDECIQTHTLSMNLDRTLENLYYVDSEKELFDGMMFHEKEEEFKMIEEEFLLSLEEMPLQSQQVQQLTLNEVQEYFVCLLFHQDVLLRARGSNKRNGCVRKRYQKKMILKISLWMTYWTNYKIRP
nr:hypothetical protein [Tanacetum cinerariifolium]